MPELPEVETYRRSIEFHLLGETLLDIRVYNPSLRWPFALEIYNLKNQMLLKVKRRGKYLLLAFSKGWIIIHLGMSGNLRISNQSFPKDKHDHVELIMTNSKILRYNDQRRFGAWLWCIDINKTPLLDSLGPEPLSNNFNGNYLFKISRRKYTPIKPWLMDSKIVAGIGNIYANECLFMSRIDPNRLIDNLNLVETIKLADSIKDILLSAIEKHGTTLQNFLQTDGMPGNFNNSLQVYKRDGKPCYICQQPIKREKQRQRSTYWCTNCQI
ncbi:bifunctional DNA-formamidopyrimidine glycosylase/DNA-(apurinic or apyrimidinic site) lyase [Candidatus Ishikawella capsulata]|uniref:Formamidopyrimidine-DNA glycosylase n=1 Tax=Candidatus Ishikawaella capsulata Mpkobe TaxID=476281 RepID=C5WDS0_9ENTR|nr:bifunctional DNA-formamidopyrimidine glycosylase/DNA-(apurinic or apyrimidinic site) lyase [Candidatus Ishikawaella capsulata]BAH83476.1 formamidopyrimidine-DNA glycosylase [Candidatus Ishikawaella capsulata Mpkobe]